MATKPQFAPGQDMSDVSPEDVIEAKRRAKATKAYDDVDKTESGKTKARQTAEYMESERMSPMTTRNRAMSSLLKGPNMLEGPSEAYDAVRSVVSPRKPRSEEEMSELTREVAKGLKKGGKVSSASARADGIAQRGKTRGTMIMCGGGMAKRK